MFEEASYTMFEPRSGRPRNSWNSKNVEPVRALFLNNLHPLLKSDLASSVLLEDLHLRKVLIERV